MHKRLRVLFLTLSASLAVSHPMGNFSVSHYARFDAKPGNIEVLYALDLAELPTFDLLRQWGLDRNSPQAELDRKGASQAREWVKNLAITSDGHPVAPQFQHAEVVIADGAGNLPILRITSYLSLKAAPGKIDYQDHNYPDRAGWKEIVIRPASGATIAKASQTATDRSKALSSYPQDPTIAPPQDVRASFEWTGAAPIVVADRTKPIVPAPSVAPVVITPIPQPQAPTPVPPAAMTPAAAPAGTVVKGDYLSRFLHQRELSLSMILIALAVAFALGAAHALTPGHGKTIVAAYLVGSRGTLKHAAFLGAMVTFTHTVSVFLLGLATLFLFQYVMPEKITQALGVISGLSIVAIGAYMLYKRLHAARHAHQHAHAHAHDHSHTHVHGPLVHSHADEHAHDHSHAHDHGPLVHSHAAEHVHDHSHAHAHSPLVHSHADEPKHDHGHIHSHGPSLHSHDHGHTHAHDHGHSHSHGPLVHSHEPGGRVHSHDVPEEITWGSLVALAVSGGLVPCESALVLLLSAIALGRVGLGLLLLISFSLGLAIVLMAIGILVIYAKNLFPKSDHADRHPAFRWIPVVSAAVVMFIGMLMTGVSLGWIQPKWMV